LHVCSNVSEAHWVAPGTQTPVQAAPTQAFWQAVGAPQAPSSLQVWTLVVDAHCVWPGLHSPPQAPSTQALAQSAGSDHRP
jgi:hypothetical protein